MKSSQDARKPITVGERRRQIEQILRTTSAIPPEPPSGIPYSAMKLLSITVVVFSITLMFESAVFHNITFGDHSASGTYKWTFLPLQIHWMYSVNFFMSVLLVFGTFWRNPIIVLIWILYAVAAGVFLGSTVPMNIINNEATLRDFFCLIAILALVLTLRMYWKFFKEIHEDTMPDTEWQFLSRPIYQHTLPGNSKNKRIAPPPNLNSMA